MLAWIIGGVIAVVLIIVAFVSGIFYRKRVGEKEIASAEEKAKRIINEAIKATESKKREALIEAKEEIHKNRVEFDKEMKERRSEVQKQEHRITQKEEAWTKNTMQSRKKKNC